MAVDQGTWIDSEQAKLMADAALVDYMTARLGEAALIGGGYEQLWKSIIRLNQAGGKRLRPYMTLLSYEVFGGDGDITAAAAAWELLHLCMLIHDDFIDNDFVRYGVDNIAGEYRKLYAPLASQDQRREHLAASAALLAGDIALSSAHDVVLRSSLRAEQKVTALQRLTDATFSVAGGEVLDYESVLYDMTEVDALAIARYKTASYSFVGPLLMGAELAGASNAQCELLHTFALELGCAYQLVDDLIGVFGDSTVTGKPTDGDIREGKRTYLMQQAYVQATAEDRATLDSIVGNETIGAEDLALVKAILVRSGAKQAVDQQIDVYVAASRQALEALQQDCPQAASLGVLFDIAIKRNY